MRGYNKVCKHRGKRFKNVDLSFPSNLRHEIGKIKSLANTLV